MHALYLSAIYNPLYNGLIGLVNLLPFADAGVIIILFTVIVRLILFPVAKKAVRTQALMKILQPEIDGIKAQHKGDRQGEAAATMAFYKKHEVNPFSSIILLFVQLPIIFALYRIFYYSGFTSIHTDVLYSFVHAPVAINTMFLGLIDVTGKSIVLAVLAAASQYFQIRLSTPAASPSTGKGGFQEDFARSMQVQMKYIFPILILFIAYNATAAIALYWTTSNLFMIGQELYIRRQIKRKGANA